MKTIVKVIGVIVLLVVIGLVLVSVSLNSIIQSGVETIGPNITGTTVTLEKVDLSVLSGEGQLHGLMVGNPQGFHTENAFELATIYVNTEVESALSDKLIIKEIIIDSPKITFEGTLSGSNISQINENVEKFSASAGEEEKERGSEEQQEDEMKIQIDHFILKNAQVSLSTPLLQGQEFTIPLPEIHLRDIGKQSGGATLQEVAALIFSAINKAIVEAVSKSGKLIDKGLEKIDEHLGGSAKDAASKVLEGVKGIFGQ